MHEELLKINNMATNPTTHKQTIKSRRLFFETDYFPFEKKTGPGQIQTQDLSIRLRRVRYLQVKWTGNAKFEFIIKQGTIKEEASRRVLGTKTFSGKKSSTRLPGYRKGNEKKVEK